MFTKRTFIRNKRQLGGESLNLSPLDEETFPHSGNPTLSSPLMSRSQSQLQSQLTTKHGMRKRHKRHRNYVEQRAIDEEFHEKLAKFASVWSTIIHSGQDLASKGLNQKADQGLERAPSPSAISSTDTDTDTDKDQAQKPVLLQRKLHEMPALRPLSKHQFTFQASQLDSTSSRALIASPREGNGEVSEQQLIASLQIDSLSSEDNGVYLCRVDFRKARSRTQESILKIVGKYSMLCEALSKLSPSRAHLLKLYFFLFNKLMIDFPFTFRLQPIDWLDGNKTRLLGTLATNFHNYHHCRKQFHQINPLFAT